MVSAEVEGQDTGQGHTRQEEANLLLSSVNSRGSFVVLFVVGFG